MADSCNLEVKIAILRLRLTFGTQTFSFAFFPFAMRLCPCTQPWQHTPKSLTPPPFPLSPGSQVKKLVIGTHHHGSDAHLLEILEGWTLEYLSPVGTAYSESSDDNLLCRQRFRMSNRYWQHRDWSHARAYSAIFGMEQLQLVALPCCPCSLTYSTSSILCSLDC